MARHNLPTGAELKVDAMALAIIEQTVVQFTYFRSPGNATLRTFSPYEFSPDQSTVIGFDHAKREMRRFELSKIAWPIEATEYAYLQPTNGE